MHYSHKNPAGYRVNVKKQLGVQKTTKKADQNIKSNRIESNAQTEY